MPQPLFFARIADITISLCVCCVRAYAHWIAECFVIRHGSWSLACRGAKVCVGHSDAKELSMFDDLLLVEGTVRSVEPVGT